jgi:hypothetical protein
VGMVRPVEVRLDQVRLGPHGQIEWPGDLVFCPDALSLTLTGKRPEDIFTGPDQARSDARAQETR